MIDEKLSHGRSRGVKPPPLVQSLRHVLPALKPRFSASCTIRDTRQPCRNQVSARGGAAAPKIGRPRVAKAPSRREIFPKGGTVAICQRHAILDRRQLTIIRLPGPTRRTRETSVNLEQRAPVDIEARLLPVVEDLLFKKGYVGLNIREISKEVGMGPATIYKYFLSKDGLALRILQDQDRQIAKAIAPMIAGGTDYVRWMNFYKALLGYYDANPIAAVVQNISMPTNTWFLPEDKWPVTDVAKIIRKLIREGRASQALDPAVADNQIMATHYMYMVREVRLWRSRDMKWRLVDRIDRFFPIVWKTISSPEVFAQPLAETRASA